MNNTSSNINNNIIVTKKRKIKNIENIEELNDGSSGLLLNGRILGLIGLLSILLFRIKKLY